MSIGSDADAASGNDGRNDNCIDSVNRDNGSRFITTGIVDGVFSENSVDGSDGSDGSGSSGDGYRSGIVAVIDNSGGNYDGATSVVLPS